MTGPDGGLRAPDGGFRDVGPDDAGTVVGADLGVDIGARDVPDDLARDVQTGEDVVDAAIAIDAADDVGLDTGVIDTGLIDTGPRDSGVVDTGLIDSGPRDTGPMDTGPMDTGPIDTGPIDTGPIDTGPIDTGPIDTGPADVGVDVPVIPDSGPPDAGITAITTYSESCTTSGTAPINGFGRYVITGSTAGRMDDHQPVCSDRATPDVGYVVTLPAFSRVTWQARPTGVVFAPVVYLTQGCGEQGPEFVNEVACANNTGAAGAARGGVVDLPAGTYFLVVDGDRDGSSVESGPFELTVTVSPSEPAPYYSVEALTSTACSTVPGTTVSIEMGDDVVSGIQSLGFDFNYFGRGLNRMAFYTNGFFAFIVDETSPWSAGNSWRNHSIVFNGPPRGVVAPLWDDLFVDNATGSGVYFWVDGSSPNRVAHVSWRNAGFFRDNMTRVSFEARLYQTTDVIEFLYCSEGRNNAFSRGGGATVGIESYDQDLGRLVGLNQAGTVAPGTGYRFTHR